MVPQLSSKAGSYKISRSPVREIMSYADPEFIRSLGIDPARLISFAGGWVDHSAPEELRQAYLEIVEDSRLFHKSGAYPHPLGDKAFKEGIIEYEKHLFNITSLDIGQIAVGLGSTQIAAALFEALLDADDKILFLDPTYCNYPTQVKHCVPGVGVIRCPVLNQDTWEYDADSRVNDVAELILKEKPKVTLLVTPDNPTSQVLSDKFVEAISYAMEEVSGFLIIDFAYKELTFGDEYPDYFSWGPTDNNIFLRSHSKWGRNLGRRLAWVEAPSRVIETMESFHSSTILTPDMLHQLAMTIFIKRAVANLSLREYVANSRSLYQTAAKEVMASIENELGFKALIPQGGLYTCMKVEMDGARFVRETLKHAEVLFVPGYGFGKTLSQGVRVSFGPLVNDLSNIREGLHRVGMLLPELREHQNQRVA